MNKIRRFAIVGFSLLISFVLVLPSHGWWGNGHAILTRAAMRSLPDEIPGFFRAGESVAAHFSYDPDLMKMRETPQTRAFEYPEHYFDLELLKGSSIPEDRYEFIKLCQEIGVEPEKVGFLPYAVAEWTGRLAVCFAEYRKWNDNAYIMTKCYFYAGILAHYAQDLCQPLHLTVDYNGRRLEDGSILGEGIHAKIDGLIEFLELNPSEIATQVTVEPVDDLMAAIRDKVIKGNSLVNAVYEIEPRLPNPENPAEWKSSPDVLKFADERAVDAAGFTASLYLTAWRLSEKIEIPVWLDREKSDTQ